MAIRNQHPEGKEISLRHVWLASLGAAAMARREARNTVGSAVERAHMLRGRASRVAADAGAVARGGLVTARERLEPKFARLGAEVEVRLAPVLQVLGLGRESARPVRKARKPAAKKATRRPAASRRRADLRIARKGR